MFITLITDCHDTNAAGRQATRYQTLFDSSVNLVAINSEIQAAGCLIDVLDASGGESGVVVANFAPREDKQHQQNYNLPPKLLENGTPFGYFFYKDTLVVTTVAGLTLSLIRKLRITDEIKVLDLNEVITKFSSRFNFDELDMERLRNTQFRSFELIPAITRSLFATDQFPTTTLMTAELEAPPKSIWHIDNWGNVKTTILPHEVNFTSGKVVSLRCGDFTCYKYLHEVPDRERALIIGSSGFKRDRLLEIVVQGGNAADELGLNIGQKLL